MGKHWWYLCPLCGRRADPEKIERICCEGNPIAALLLTGLGRGRGFRREYRALALDELAWLAGCATEAVGYLRELLGQPPLVDPLEEEADESWALYAPDIDPYPKLVVEPPRLCYEPYGASGMTYFVDPFGRPFTCAADIPRPLRCWPGDAHGMVVWEIPNRKGTLYDYPEDDPEDAESSDPSLRR